MNTIQIQAYTDIHSLDKIVELQTTFWGDPSIVIQRNMLWSLVNSGGAVHVAIHQQQVVGFVLSFLGLHHKYASIPARDNLKLISQRMTVLPDYRHQGVGYQLKLAQRDYARQLDLNLITWTFDPLISRNAHFNIHKLSAICRCFIQDYYGVNSSLSLFGSTDRLMAEWWINDNIDRHSTYTDYLATTPLITPYDQTISAPRVMVEIPYDYTNLQSANLAHLWRQYSRNIFPKAFDQGYHITDFVHNQRRSFYILTKSC